MLQALIAGRLPDSSEIKSIIEEILDNDNKVSELTKDMEMDSYFDDDDMFQSQPMIRKAASPFTNIFLDIELSTIKGVSNTLNLLFNEVLFLIFNNILCQSSFYKKKT